MENRSEKSEHSVIFLKMNNPLAAAVVRIAGPSLEFASKYRQPIQKFCSANSVTNRDAPLARLCKVVFAEPSRRLITQVGFPILARTSVLAFSIFHFAVRSTLFVPSYFDLFVLELVFRKSLATISTKSSSSTKHFSHLFAWLSKKVSDVIEETTRNCSIINC